MGVPSAGSREEGGGIARQPDPLLAILALLAILIPLSGCDLAGDPREEGAPDAPSIHLDPAVAIGEVEGDPDYLFGNVRSVAVDDRGRIYVGDLVGATVRVYSADGAFLERIARAGQGPGEIDGWPAALSFGPDGRLYVRDASRITVFEPSAPGGVALTTTWLAGPGNLTHDRSRVGDDGTYYYPDGRFRIGEQPRFFYYALREGTPTGDTIEVPSHPGLGARRPAFYRLGGGSGRLVYGLSSVPFAPVPSWDVTPDGTLLSSDGRSPHLLETDATGDTLRLIPLGYASRPVSAGEREDSLRALEARIDSLPVPLEDVINLGENVAERRLPELRPTVVSVHVAADGSIWVERWPPEGAADFRVYDLIDRDGTRRASVTLRAPLVPEPPPYFGRGAIVGVVRDEATGVQRVVRFDMEGIPP